MNRTLAKIVSLPGTVIHSLVIPLFAFLFTLYYQPMMEYDILSMPHSSFAFNVTILFCIVLGSVLLSRFSLYALGRYRSISGKYYILWCAGELMLTALFSSLYIVLMSRGKLAFFETAGMAYLSLLATSVYPYVILWLCFERHLRNIDQPLSGDENSLIRFYDEYKKLRLVIADEAVIFIKCEDNYVQIHYLDRNKTKKFILRSSMRALEEDLLKHGLVRCHRSYFINPSYIKIVHRDEAGLLVAELELDGFESIPISRKYQDEITRLL